MNSAELDRLIATFDNGSRLTTDEGRQSPALDVRL